MKIFEEKYEAIEYCLKDKTGKEVVISTKPLTISDEEKVRKLQDKMKKEFKVDHVFDILKITFGEDKKTFENFSLNLLTDLIIQTGKDLTDQYNKQKEEKKTAG